MGNLQLYAQITETNSSGIESIELGLRYSIMSPTGTIQYRDASSEISTTFPASGKSSSFTSPTIAGGFEIGRSSFFLGWNPVEFSASGKTQKPNLALTPDGLTLIPAGSEALSRISMQIYSLIWTKDMASTPKSTFGLGAGLMFIDYRSDYGIIGYDLSSEFNQVFPAPMLSLSYAYRLNRLELQALAGGVGVKIQGNEIAYLNFDAAVRFILFHSGNWLGLFSAGIKYIPFHLYIATDELQYKNDFEMVGPFFGLRVRRVLTKD
jgi:hypothetical protein